MNIWGIFFGMIFSTIGFYYFKYGKKNQSVIHMICGGILMVSPYFIGNIIWICVVSIIIMLIPILINNYLN